MARKIPGLVVLSLLGLLLWHAALRRHGLSLPLMVDEGEYAYEARLLAEGHLPYRDAYCQKPPLIFFLYRLSYLFSPRPESPRTLALLFSWGTMLMLLGLTPSSWRWPARLSAPAMFGVLSTSPIGDLGFAANTEVFLAAFMTLSALSLKRSWSSPTPQAWLLLCGFSAGLALMTKQTAVWSAIAFGALAMWGKQWPKARRSLASFTLSLAVAPVFFIVYFWSRGGLKPLLEQAFLRNLDYARVVVMSGGVSMQLSWLAATVAPLFLIGDWPAYALTVYGLLGTSASLHKKDETLATLWLGTSLAGIMTGLFFFPHYFLQAMPPLALTTAIGVERALERGGKRLRAAGVLFPVCLSLYPALVRAQIYFFDSPQAAAKRLLYPNALYEAYPIAAYVREHSKPADKLYIFGSEPQIYAYAERWAATTHIFCYPLTLFPKDEAEISTELGQLEQNPPKFLLYSTQPASTLIASRLGETFRDGIRDLLRRRYRWVGSVEVTPEPSALTELLPAKGQPDFSSQSSLLLFQVGH